MRAISSILLAVLGLTAALRVPGLAPATATACVGRAPAVVLVETKKAKEEPLKEPHPTLARFFNPWGATTRSSEKSSLAQREEQDKAIEEIMRIPLKVADELLQPFTGGLKTMLQESETDVSLVIDEAHQALMADPRVTETLGDDLDIGEVYYHASSSSSIGDISVRDQFMQFYIGDGHERPPGFSPSSAIHILSLHPAGSLHRVACRPRQSSQGTSALSRHCSTSSTSSRRPLSDRVLTEGTSCSRLVCVRLSRPSPRPMASRAQTARWSSSSSASRTRRGT